jgi:hypothetical protein
MKDAEGDVGGRRWLRGKENGMGRMADRLVVDERPPGGRQAGGVTRVGGSENKRVGFLNNHVKSPTFSSDLYSNASCSILFDPRSEVALL